MLRVKIESKDLLYYIQQMLSNPNYKVGRVYRIICTIEPTIQYIGSTFNELRHRWQHHKKGYRNYLKNNKGTSINQYFKKYGIEHFKIVLIKEYTVCASNDKDHKHLMVYEQLWISKTKCVNINNTFHIRNLSTKQWYEENKDIINLKSRETRASNRIMTRCDCSDKPFLLFDIKEHTKCKRHIHFINTGKKKPNKHDNKYNQIMCVCGSIITLYTKKRHNTSKIHINYINNLEPNLIFID